MAYCVNNPIVASALCVGDDIENIFFFFLFSLGLSSTENAGCCFHGYVLRGNSIQAKATLGLSLTVCPL